MITKSPNSLPKHNSTLDKQGGDSTSNDYYHLTEEEVTTIHNTSGINTGDQTSSDFDHNSLQNTHNLTSDIDHNTIFNTHNLTSDIDHNLLDNLQGGDSTSNEYYHLSLEEHSQVLNRTEIASDTSLGVIKVGNNLSISGDGTLSSTSESQMSITVETPTASEDICIGYTFVAITITEIQTVIAGTSCTINPCHGSDRSSATNTILAAATAITNTTTGQNISGESLNDNTVPADSWIVLKTTESTTCTQLTVVFKYTID